MPATPMMAQYLAIKAEAPDALLFYRMGDFYELFFEDAVAAATALDITLTKRGQHLGRDIEMCGVPVHSAEGYLTTLIRRGFRVAVAEQLEPPEEARRRGSKAVVARGIVRLVTPGTLTEEALLDARAHNYLAAWCDVRGDGALAWADISTGAVHVAACPRVRLGPDLARLGVAEVVLVDGSDAARRSASRARRRPSSARARSTPARRARGSARSGTSRRSRGSGRSRARSLARWGRWSNTSS